MRSRVFLAALALVACGREPATEDRAIAAEPAAPRTLDKGDGCVVQLLHAGAGPTASVGDEVTIAYDLKLRDTDQCVASTRGWDVPLRVRLGESGVVPGLARGIEGLQVGSKARIEVPPALGYGAQGSPASGVPSDAHLVFDVEILGVRR